MKGVFRKLLLFFALLLAFTLWKLPYSQFLREQFDQTRRELAKGGIFVDVAEIQFKFPLGVTFTNLSGMIKGGVAPIPFLIDSGEAFVHLLPLFKLKSVGNVAVRAYGGELRSEISRHLQSSDTAYTFELANLELSKHPILEFYGLGGKLGARGDLQIQHPFPSGEIEMTTEGGRLEKAQQLGPFRLPVTSDLNARLALQSTGTELRLRALQASSSLGTATGNGNCSLEPREILDDCSLLFALDLTPEGVTAFGGWLALASGGKVESPGSRWKIQVSKGKNLPFQSKVSEAN